MPHEMLCGEVWPNRLPLLQIRGEMDGVSLLSDPWSPGDSNAAPLCYEIVAGRCLADLESLVIKEG